MKAAYTLLWLLCAILAVALGTLVPMFIGDTLFSSDRHGFWVGLTISFTCMETGPPATLIAYCIAFWGFTRDQAFRKRLLQSGVASMIISTILVVSWMLIWVH